MHELYKAAPRRRNDRTGRLQGQSPRHPTGLASPAPSPDMVMLRRIRTAPDHRGAAMAEPAASAEKPPITIKKYANRRLYNTATSSYVTLDHLCQMVKDNEDFVVYDAKTGEDITRSVLTQIIVEEESKGGQNLLPIPFLRQLIGFYGDQLGGLVPKYLEHSMQAFGHHEGQMRQYMQQAFDGLFPFN